MINKSKYEALSASQKKVIDDHCTPRMVGEDRDAVGGFRGRPAATRSRREAGHEVDPLTAEQLAEWRKAAEPLMANGPRT